MSPRAHRTLALIILDGWGYRQDSSHNPTQQVETPTFDKLYAESPYALLEASGIAVGLPAGQMGNSEVGHLHIGAGRKVPQDLTRINQCVVDKSFFKNPVLSQALGHAKERDSTVHLLGLLSPGGVHSVDTHIAAMIEMIARYGIERHCLHAILDGRDTPPRSAKNSIEKINALYQKIGHGSIASLIGRYYAMDRDQRLERTQVAYELFVNSKANFITDSALKGLEWAYENGQNDEFIKPVCIHSANAPAKSIRDNDLVIFMNFRADRARQLSHALTQSGLQLANFVTLTEYDKNLKAQVAFPPLTLKNTLGEYIANQGMHQLRIAETEKYAHVTYFINGGHEQAFANEDRELVPSPKIATYDLQPEMSALALTQRLIAAINRRKYDLIICNYANPDMVGHTGIEKAANLAVSTVDQCLKQVLSALKNNSGEALITADHGNIECMYDETHQQPHTAHTNNPVPLFYVGRSAKLLQKTGALDDIAPTLLSLLGLTPPPEMTGKPLIKLC